MTLARHQQGSTAAIVLLIIGVIGVLVVAGLGIYRSSEQAQSVQSFERSVQALEKQFKSSPGATFIESASSAWPVKNDKGQPLSPWGVVEFSEPSKGERKMAFEIPAISCTDAAVRLEHRADKLVVVDAQQGQSKVLKDSNSQAGVKFSAEEAVSACGTAGFRRIEATFATILAGAAN